MWFIPLKQLYTDPRCQIYINYFLLKDYHSRKLIFLIKIALSTFFEYGEFELSPSNYCPWVTNLRCSLLLKLGSAKPESIYRSSQWCSIKKVFFKISQNSQESTCARVSFLIKLQAFIKKETLEQVVFCEFCEILKNIFFTEHLRAAASVFRTESNIFIAIWDFLTKIVTLLI